MKKLLRKAWIVFLVFVTASWLSVYSYGRFANQVAGTPSFAESVQPDETVLDRAITALTRDHAGLTGIALLTDNLDAFAIRGMTAREAERSLDLQYYIWHDDLTGRLLGHELLRAADRGVRVRLLLDDLNAHDKDTLLAILNLHPNIQVRVFNPSRGRQSGFRRGIEMVLRGFSLNRRMHNKAWIADGRIAVVGGRNIGNEYFDAASDINFVDVDVAVVGEAVREVEVIFDDFWNSTAAIPLEALVKANPQAIEALRRENNQGFAQALTYLEKLHRSSSVRALFEGHYPLYWTSQAHVLSDPAAKAYGRQEADWLIHSLSLPLNDAHRELHLISPYFVPGEAGTRLLSRLKEKDVEVRILTNSLAATDVVAVHGGYARYRRPLLENGVELYELMPHGPPENHWFGSSGASLHTKAFVIDDHVGFVGSFNMDPRSVKLNTEMGILFDAPDLAAELNAVFRHRTATTQAYRLQQSDTGDLLWWDGSVEPMQIWEGEPEAGVWRRITAKVMGWLPIESQL